MCFLVGGSAQKERISIALVSNPWSTLSLGTFPGKDGYFRMPSFFIGQIEWFECLNLSGVLDVLKTIQYPPDWRIKSPSFPRSALTRQVRSNACAANAAVRKSQFLHTERGAIFSDKPIYLGWPCCLRSDSANLISTNLRCRRVCNLLSGNLTSCYAKSFSYYR